MTQLIAQVEADRAAAMEAEAARARAEREIAAAAEAISAELATRSTPPVTEPEPVAATLEPQPEPEPVRPDARIRSRTGGRRGRRRVRLPLGPTSRSWIPGSSILPPGPIRSSSPAAPWIPKRAPRPTVAGAGRAAASAAGPIPRPPPPLRRRRCVSRPKWTPGSSRGHPSPSPIWSCRSSISRTNPSRPPSRSRPRRPSRY